MLASMDIRLFPMEDCQLPHPCAHLIHAAVLSLVRDRDDAMSARLHDGAQVKPFAISTLWPRTRMLGDHLSIPKYTECRVRISTMGRDVFDAVTCPLFSRLATQETIELSGRRFMLRTAGLDAPYGGAANWRSLLCDTGTQTELKFVSPTTFRRRGLNVPIPDPGLVYGSLWQKWQAFSDTPVEEGIFEEMTSALVLCRAAVHTRVWKYPHFMMTGFVGKAGFELAKPVSQEARQLFGALSGLAFYTGVGYKTTMGMGQCFRMDESEGIKHE